MYSDPFSFESQDTDMGSVDLSTGEFGFTFTSLTSGLDSGFHGFWLTSAIRLLLDLQVRVWFFLFWFNFIARSLDFVVYHIHDYEGCVFCRSDQGLHLPLEGPLNYISSAPSGAGAFSIFYVADQDHFF